MDRRLLLSGVGCSLVALVAKADPTNPADSPTSVSGLTFDRVRVDIGQVTIALDARSATVPVSLSEAAAYAVHVHLITQNGSGAVRAIEGAQFRRTNPLLVFRPGETLKHVTIPTMGGPEGAAFALAVQDQVEPTLPGVDQGKRGLITFSALNHTASMPPETNLSYPAPVTRGKTLFEEDFTSFHAVDGGSVKAWSTGDGSRTQPANNEPTLYTDPALMPGTKPYEVVAGTLNLFAQEFRSPVTWRGRSYTLGAAMLSTQKMFQFTHGRVSADLILPTCRYGWPGFWLYGEQSSEEIDIVEVFRESGYSIFDSNAAVHGPKSVSAKLRTNLAFPSGLDLTQWHNFALEWRRDWTVWFIDNQEIYRVQTTCRLPKYVVLDMTLQQGATSVSGGTSALQARNIKVTA
jgi:hypothetical protein